MEGVGGEVCSYCSPWIQIRSVQSKVHNTVCLINFVINLIREAESISKNLVHLNKKRESGAVQDTFNLNNFIHSLVFSLEAGLAGTRAQSCDRYGSGTLHPGKVLGGSLPLLSPTFRRSHFSRQVPLSATT